MLILPPVFFYLIPLLYVLIQYCLATRCCESGNSLPKSNIPGVTLVAVYAVIIWCAFHLLLVPYTGNFLLYSIWTPPEIVTCPFYYEKCQLGVVDGWSAYHLFDHLIAGVLYPHVSFEYHFVLFQSVICEVGEFLAGERARFVVDPATNLLGYLLGNAVSWGYHRLVRRSRGGRKAVGCTAKVREIRFVGFRKLVTKRRGECFNPTNTLLNTH